MKSKNKVALTVELSRINSHIRQVFSKENHGCLSLGKCVNDQVEINQHRLRRKSKMTIK